MLQYPLRVGPTEELVWYVAEANALRKVRAGGLGRRSRRADRRDAALGDAGPAGLRRAAPERLDGRLGDRAGPDEPRRAARPVWRVEDGVLERRRLGRVHAPGPVAGLLRRGPGPARRSPLATIRPVRHRDLLLEATGADADLLVHELLIRFCAAFLDQGLAHWPLPRPRRGVLSAPSARSIASPAVRRSLDARAGAGAGAARTTGIVSPLESIRESLEVLGVAAEEWEGYLSATLLALRGWAGMVRQIEARGDRVRPAGTAGQPRRVPGDPALARPLRPGVHGREALGFTGPLERAARRVQAADRVALAAERRAAGLPGLPAGPAHGPLARRPLPAEQAGVEDDARGDRVVHRARAATRLPPGLRAAVLHPDRRRRGPARRASGPEPGTLPDSRRSSASTSAKSRSAGIWRSSPRRRHVRHGRFLLRRDLLSRRGRRPFRPALSGGDAAAALGRRAGDRRATKAAHRLRARTRRALGMASYRFNVGSRSLTAGAVLAARSSACWHRSRWSRACSFPASPRGSAGGSGRFVQSPPLTRLQLERAGSDPRA